jgi:site-specific DNA-methyltransferase (adenine-specific)/adenine-specific DNA-methyltransferase
MLPRKAGVRRGPSHANRPNEAHKATMRLAWPGRTWEPGAPVQAEPASSIPSETGDARSRLVHGDALDVARALAREGLAGKVDLVYVDPPFASQAAYVHEARLDGPADGRIVRTEAYDDRWEGDGVGGYLDMLAPRLEALARLLAATGTIWVHVDWRASYLVRMVLDEVLGRRAFVNEIVWRRAPNLGRQAASHQFGRTLDTLVVYGGAQARLAPPTRLEPIEPRAIKWDAEKRPFTSAPRGDYTDESIARLEKEGRVHRTASGKAYIKYFLVQGPDGAWCRERRIDALWTDVPPLRHAPAGERTGFPTQKPRALLDRIIACASPPGGLVVDAFAGSGTTGESAHALGRRFVVADASPLAIGTARARLLRAGVDVSVEQCGVAPTAVPGAEDAESPRLDVTWGEGVRVELLAPREPLAWAIDVSHRRGGPLERAWHSERVPGTRARPAERSAVLDRAAGPVAVRVWYDDGRVVTCVVEGP